MRQRDINIKTWSPQRKESLRQQWQMTAGRKKKNPCHKMLLCLTKWENRKEWIWIIHLTALLGFIWVFCSWPWCVKRKYYEHNSAWIDQLIKYISRNDKHNGVNAIHFNTTRYILSNIMWLRIYASIVDIHMCMQCLNPQCHMTRHKDISVDMWGRLQSNEHPMSSVKSHDCLTGKQITRQMKEDSLVHFRQDGVRKYKKATIYSITLFCIDFQLKKKVNIQAKE